MPIKHCVECGIQFEAKTAKARYCSATCSNREGLRLKGHSFVWDKDRHCRQCGKTFRVERKPGATNRGNNRWYCSPDCALQGARESRSRFWKRQADPKATRRVYDDRRRDRVGPDGNLKRFYARFPNAPRKCESCGEHRVVDIAHKPGHKRNGAWRSVENVQWPQKVWILCPTCHALLDRMHYNPEELGLRLEARLCQRH
jgi:hypothetical protein